MTNNLLTSPTFQTFMHKQGESYLDQTKLELRLPNQQEYGTAFTTEAGNGRGGLNRITHEINANKVVVRDPQSPHALWTIERKDAQQMFGSGILDKLNNSFSTHGVAIKMMAIRITPKFINAMKKKENIHDLYGLPRDNSRGGAP